MHDRDPWQEVSLLDTLLFVERFLAAPARVGSAIPSSRHLARRMAGAVDWDRVRTAVELGAGSGAITAALWQHRRPGTTLVAFERDPVFRQHLSVRFPDILVAAEAAALRTAVPAASAGTVDAVISGLPFALLPRGERAQILGAVHASLRPGGRFVAFQYSLALYPALRRLYRHVRVHFVPLNLPPAFVYSCEK